MSSIRTVGPVRVRAPGDKKRKAKHSARAAGAETVAAQDEEILLAATWAAFHRARGQTHDVQVVEAPNASSYEQLGPPGESVQAERMIIQNWKMEAEFISLAGAEIELQPGDAVTLWLSPAHPGLQSWQRHHEAVSSRLTILCEDEPLLG